MYVCMHVFIDAWMFEISWNNENFQLYVTESTAGKYLEYVIDMFGSAGINTLSSWIGDSFSLKNINTNDILIEIF